MTTLRATSIKTSPIVATGLALAACYGTLCLTLLLPAIGIPFAVPGGPWAATIVIFTLVALATFALRARHHRNWKPFTLAGIGAAAITWVMSATYLQQVEIAGFTVMIIAALWDRRVTA